jgi:oxygen-dependent protoporphyrinogen oxidase
MARTLAVVGGGIAGLTTAFELVDRTRGRADAPDVVCLEAAPQAGGKVRSERADGFTCEWGPNGFLDNSPATPELIRRLGLEDRLQPSDPAAELRYLYRGGRLHPVPMGIGPFLTSGMLTWGEKLRLAIEGLQPQRRDGTDESILDFASRRIGAGAAAVMVDAMVSGIYAGDSRRLSLAATFPKMAAMERDYGSLTRAMLAKRKAAKAVAGPGQGRLTSFRGGMQDLIDGLIGALGPRLRGGAAVRALARSNGRYTMRLADGTSLQADQVAVTVPAWNAAPMVEELDAELAQVLGEIPSAPVVVCHLGFDQADLQGMPHGFGFLIPRNEGLRLLGVLWASTIFPGRAPQGKALYTCMLGGARDLESIDWPDGKVSSTVLDELHTTMHLHAKPIFTRIYRHRRGIPQYTLGHLDRLARVAAALARHPGLHVGGNSYRGISANDCIRHAGALAERMLG